MSIRLLEDGSLEFDTIKEALAAQELVAQRRDIAKPRRGPKPRPRCNEDSDRFRAIFVSRKETQAAFAAALGISQTRMSRMLTGQIPVSPEILEAAEILAAHRAVKPEQP